MAEKTFFNSSPATLQITLFIREGTNPLNQDGTISFSINSGETKLITYGNEQNIFLNGILVFTIFIDLYSKIQFVTLTGSELDSLLNTNSELTFTKVQTDYIISATSTFLDAVNNALTIDEMRDALENPGLELNLTAYNALSEELKDEVALDVLSGRPIDGYPTVDSVQAALDVAIDELVNPDNIFVQAGTVGGNGSSANPFGTIAQGIAAVNPGGTVNVLSGTYPITSRINLNKAGITLNGEAGPTLLLQANVIPLLISADNITIKGFTITSDIPYPREFIQVGGDNTTLTNNTIFGPAQPLPMSSWIVNRAVVSQGSVSGLTVTENTFYSLRSGMYINPNVTGIINNNIVYNTKGGFLVDRAFTTFQGNSWGIPVNEFDIVLFPGTTTGPPYDNLIELSAENSNATIFDQRL